MAVDIAVEDEQQQSVVSQSARRMLASRPVQIILVEVVLISVFYALSPNGAFLNETNLKGMFLTGSQVLLLVVGQAILMSAAHIDISQGAVVILSSVLAGKLMIQLADDGHTGLAIAAALVVAAGTGMAVGLINGVMVAVVGVNSLVATLAMLGIVTGAAQVVTSGVNLTGLPQEMAEFGTYHIGVFPGPLLVSAAVILVIWLLFAFTAWGAHVLAMGSNFRAAHRVGIRTLRNTLGIFMLSGALAGLAGFIDLSRYSTTNISGHVSDSMAAIAGALIGGTALTGGRISILGAIVGAFFAIILQSGLVIINISPFYQTIAVGLLLLIAVSLDPSTRLRGGGRE